MIRKLDEPFFSDSMANDDFARQHQIQATMQGRQCRDEKIYTRRLLNMIRHCMFGIR